MVAREMRASTAPTIRHSRFASHQREEVADLDAAHGRALHAGCPGHHRQGRLPTEARRNPPSDGLLGDPWAFHAAGPDGPSEREVPPVSERDTVGSPGLVLVRELHRDEVVGALPPTGIHIGRVDVLADQARTRHPRNHRRPPHDELHIGHLEFAESCPTFPRLTRSEWAKESGSPRRTMRTCSQGEISIQFRLKPPTSVSMRRI